jgi:hypothetical protein
MPEESAEKKSVFVVFPVIAYALVAAGVFDIASQIAQGFASSSSSGATAEFTQQLKAATFRIASPFAILLMVFALVVLAALFYLRPRNEIRQGWYLAVAAAALASLVVAAASLYDIIALLAGDDDFQLSNGTLKFSYTVDWLSALVLGLAGLFIAIRLWSATNETEELSESGGVDEEDRERESVES